MVKTDKQHDCTLIAKDLFGNLVLASDTMPGAKQRKKVNGFGSEASSASTWLQDLRKVTFLLS